MEHPVFGTIELEPGRRQWAGRVQIDFFSGYDTVVAALVADKLGVPNWQRAPDNRHLQGDFPLSVMTPDGSQPSLWQERAFLQFRDNLDLICGIVVNAIFDHYQAHWGAWRATNGPGQGEPYTDDILIPELAAREDLRRVIRLEGLSVLDFPPDDYSLLGYCFACSWDPEHGLGVLVRDRQFIEIGENDLTWSAPKFAGKRGSLGPPTRQQIGEQRGIAAIKKLGGAVTLDATPGQPVVRVSFPRTRPTQDADLGFLKHFPSLRQLELADSQVTDAGLIYLRDLKQLEMLHLSGTAISDAGLKELTDLKNLKLLHVSRTKVTDAGLKALREHKTLTVLHLNDTGVSDTGLEELGALPSMQHVELSETRVTDAGLERLKELRGMVSLDVQGTLVTDAGLSALKEFKSLRYLNLSRTQVTDTGLAYLKDIKTLRTLKLQGTGATDGGIADLQRGLPRLQIHR
jgi:Leucine-rich repeat (LRR) protein